MFISSARKYIAPLISQLREVRIRTLEAKGQAPFLFFYEFNDNIINVNILVLVYVQESRSPEESRSPVMELRSEVFNRFIELKLRSAVHEDTGYVSSVLTAT